MASLPYLPTLDQFTTEVPSFAKLAPGSMSAPPPKQKTGIIGPGLSAGIDELQGLGGAAVGAIGQAVGAQGLADWGARYSAQQQAEAAKNGRPDLEVAPWNDGGAPVLPWIGYQVAKQVPQVAAGIAAAALVPEAAIPAAVARAGAAAPVWLGGGGLNAAARAGMTAAAEQAAGRTFAKGMIGGAAAAYPQAVGSMYGEALDRGDANQGDALKALALGVPYAALDALETPQLMGFAHGALSKGSKAGLAGLAGRVGKGIAAGALTEMPTEAAQTAMEMSFRPDLPLGTKAHAIVDAALTGGVVGGVFGGMTNVRALKSADPTTVTNEDLTAAIDAPLALGPDGKQLQIPYLGKPSGPTMYATPDGQAASSLREAQMANEATADLNGGQMAFPGMALQSQAPVPEAFNPPTRSPYPFTVGGDGQIDMFGGPDPEQLAFDLTGRAPAQPRARVERGGQMVFPGMDRVAPPEPPAQGDLFTPRPQAAREPTTVNEQQLPLDIATPSERRSQMRQLAMEITGRTKTDRVVGQITAEDEVGLVDQALRRLESGKGGEESLKLAEQIASRYGVMDSPDTLRERGAAAIEALRTARQSNDVQGMEAARAEVRATTQALDMLQKVEQRRNGGRTDAAPVAPAVAEPRPTPAGALAPSVSSTQQTALGEKLAPVARTMEYEAARAQAEAQNLGAVPEQLPNLPPATGLTQPSQINTEVPAVGAAQNSAQRKTLEGFNQLSQDQQERILALEELQGGEPLANLHSLITQRRDKGGQVKLRERMAQVAGVEPSFFERVRVPRPPKVDPYLERFGPATPAYVPPPVQRPAPPPTRTPGPLPPIPQRQAERTEPRRGASAPDLPPVTQQEERGWINEQIDALINPAYSPTVYRQLKRLVDNPMVPNADLAQAVMSAAKMVRERQVPKQEGTPPPTVKNLQGRAKKGRAEGKLVGNKSIKVGQALKKGDEGVAAALQLLRSVNADRISDEADRQTSAAFSAKTLAWLRSPDDGGPTQKWRQVVDAKKGIAHEPNGTWDARMLVDKGFTDATGAAAPQAWQNEANFPEWYTDVRSTLDSLAKSLGLPAAPELWVGKVTPDTADLNGEASGLGKIWLRDTMSRSQALAVGLHELGHIVQYQKFLTAPEQVRKAIFAAYKRDTANPFKTLGQRKPITSDGSGVQHRIASSEYHNSFPEWFAEQVSRWLTTNEKPVGVIENFFAGIARMWQQIYNRVTGHIPLDVTVDEFMRGTWRNDPELGPDGGGKTLTLDAKEFNVVNSDKFTEKVMDQAKKLEAKVNTEKVSDATLKSHLYMTTINHISQMFGKLFKSGGLQQYPKAHAQRATHEQRWAKLSMEPLLDYEKMEKASPKAAELTRKLMLSYTGFNIDPRKDWAAHDHLHGDRNEKVLRKKVAEANEEYRKLRQMQQAGTYEKFLAANEAQHFASMVMSLHNMVSGDTNFANSIKLDPHPEQKFINKSSLHDNPKSARDWWKGELDKSMKAVQDYIDAQTANVKGGSTKGLAVDPLQRKMADLTAKIEAMDRAPYFHVGRQGEYYVEFRIGQKGKDVDPAKQEAVAQKLADAGFTNIEIPLGSNNPKVFIRTETKQEMANLFELTAQLEKDGLLQERGQGKDTATRGLRSNDSEAYADRNLLNQLMQVIDASFQSMDTDNADEQKVLNQNKAALKSQINEFVMNLMPDSSQTKVLLHRDFVPGYSKDALRNYAFRTQVGAHALANLATVPQIVEAMGSMRNDIRTAKGDRTADPVTMQRVFEEISKREAGRSASVPVKWVDMVRAANHTYFLGMSPSYAAVQLTQLPVLLWPELSKHKGGFVQAAKSIAKVTPAAFRIMKEVAKEGWAAGSSRVADVNITESALTKALGGDEATAQFVMKMVNSGKIDLGSATREHGRIVEGRESGYADKALRWGGMFGLYSETLTRLIAAMSAREMVGKNDPNAVEYATRVVDEAMMNYQSYNIARATGNQGVAGAYTKIGTSFLQYQFQLLEKMYRELHTIMTKDASPEDKAAARRFMGAHLTAVAALSGTLGLPLASVVARVIDGMGDVLGDDDEPYDVKTAWRHFLTDTFGDTMGSVLARGAPRAAGFDISQRVGEQDVLPLSKLLTDRREWKDKLNDWAFRTLGSPVSMGKNLLEGMTQIGNGNLMEGMKALVPAALKGPIEAYKMTERGYTDAQGNALPMEPGAGAILAQIMGFNPAEKAAYTEEAMALKVRRGLITREAQNIRKNLASAIEQQDMSTAREWLQEAKRFDKSHPAYAILPGIGGVLASRATKQGTASALGAPLGINVRDLGELKFARYMQGQ